MVPSIAVALQCTAARDMEVLEMLGCSERHGSRWVSKGHVNWLSTDGQTGGSPMLTLYISTIRCRSSQKFRRWRVGRSDPAGLCWWKVATFQGWQQDSPAVGFFDPWSCRYVSWRQAPFIPLPSLHRRLDVGKKVKFWRWVNYLLGMARHLRWHRYRYRLNPRVHM